MTGSARRSHALVLRLCGVIAVLTAAIPGPQVGAATPAPVSMQGPVTGAGGGLWLIFVDDLHLDFRNTGHLRELLKRISLEVFRTGDLFGIFSSGPTSLRGDVTNTRQAFEKAAVRVSGAGLRPAEILSPSSTTEVEYRACLALSTAFDMMVRLASVHDRRKAVIYISNGYNFDVWPGAVPAAAANRNITPRDRLGVSQLREEMSRLIGAAARANVKVFAIDPRRPAGAGSGAGVDSEALRKYWEMSQNSLRVMSEETGGFALLGEADVADGLERISRSMRD
jgi:hypothetical protein